MFSHRHRLRHPFVDYTDARGSALRRMAIVSSSFQKWCCSWKKSSSTSARWRGCHGNEDLVMYLSVVCHKISVATHQAEITPNVSIIPVIPYCVETALIIENCSIGMCFALDFWRDAKMLPDLSTYSFGVQSRALILTHIHLPNGQSLQWKCKLIPVICPVCLAYGEALSYIIVYIRKQKRASLSKSAIPSTDLGR